MKPTIGRRLALHLATFATVTGTLTGTLTGALTVNSAAIAAAPGVRIDAKPERVVVDQSFENIRWSVRNRRGCLEDADVTLEHVRSGTKVYSDYDYWPRNGLNGTLKAYDFVRMGRYRVHGEGWNHCGRGLGAYSTFSADVIMVKRAARVALSGHHLHRRLKLTAKVTKYVGRRAGWANHRGVRVVFQRKTASGWKALRSDATNRRGIATVGVRSLARARYRAVVRPTATVWSDASRAIRR